MSIVSVEELNAHMSSPSWANEQQRAAQVLLDAIEGTLASALGTYITPPADPLVERVGVSSTTGLVLLEYPVHDVEQVNGVAGPTNYARRNGRLYALVPPVAGTMVTVAYRPGWGAAQALRDAILERAATRFDNRHDDTVTIRDDSASRNNTSAADKAWPDEATLTTLRSFRRIGVFR